MAALASLIVAGSAQAADTPMLVSVGQQNGHPQATFGPLYGVDSLNVLIATKPDRGSDGNFLQENTLYGHSGFLTDREIAFRSWRSESRLEPRALLRHGSQLEPRLLDDLGSELQWRPLQHLGRAHADGSEAGAEAEVSDTRERPALHRRRVPDHERVAARRRCEAALPGLLDSVAGKPLPRSTVSGHSWYSPASDFLSVSLRKMRKLTTFTWYVDGRVVSVKRVRIRR